MHCMDQLKTECSFPDKITEENMLMRLRGDYNGTQWWTDYTFVDKDHPNNEAGMECDGIRDIITDELENLEDVEKFCKDHPDANVEGWRNDRYDFYFEGEHADFHIKLMYRPKDYNLYIYGYEKDAKI